MLKIRRPLGRLIFNMGIAIPGKTVFLIETAPWVLFSVTPIVLSRVYISNNRAQSFLVWLQRFHACVLYTIGHVATTAILWEAFRCIILCYQDDDDMACGSAAMLQGCLNKFQSDWEVLRTNFAFQDLGTIRRLMRYRVFLLGFIRRDNFQSQSPSEFDCQALICHKNLLISNCPVAAQIMKPPK